MMSFLPRSVQACTDRPLGRQRADELPRSSSYQVMLVRSLGATTRRRTDPPEDSPLRAWVYDRGTSPRGRIHHLSRLKRPIPVQVMNAPPASNNSKPGRRRRILMGERQPPPQGVTTTLINPPISRLHAASMALSTWSSVNVWWLRGERSRVPAAAMRDITSPWAVVNQREPM